MATKKKLTKVLKITMGLPGSGKSHWSNEEYGPTDYYNRRHKEMSILNFDQLTLMKSKDIDKTVKTYLTQYLSSYNTVIVDGMFLSYNDVEKLLSLINDKDQSIISVSIEYWEPNIEYCLFNDIGRRDVNSKITIQNAKLDVVNDEFISKLEVKFPNLAGRITYNKHKVVKKPDWKAFAESNGLYFDAKGDVNSESWCMGGTWGDCWGGNGTVSSEPEPEGFAVLDELLEKICPNITFLQYKSIYREVVSSDTRNEGDYYGGSVTYGYKSFNVERLYKILKEKNLI